MTLEQLWRGARWWDRAGRIERQTLRKPASGRLTAAGLLRGRHRLYFAKVSDNGFVASIESADVFRITLVPGQRSGRPCIRGFRVMVRDVLDMPASGMSEDEILSDYPYLEKADFPAVYAYAAQAERGRMTR